MRSLNDIIIPEEYYLMAEETKRKSDRSKKKGGLTGSVHFETPETNQNQVSTVVDNVKNAASTVASTVGRVANTAQQINGSIKQVRRAVNGGSPLVTDEAEGVLNQAKSVATGYGVQLIDLSSELSGDPYKASSSIPLTDAKDANREKLTIQKQNNSLEIRLERVKQKRKVAAIHKEELSLVGDIADIRKTGFDVAKKFVQSEISHVQFQTEQSKLEENEELLEQQIIRTQGVINLTQGIKTEWDLKLQKQARSNEQLEIEIQGMENTIQKRRAEIEADMFS